MDKIFILLVTIFLTIPAWSQSDSIQNPFDIIGRDTSAKVPVVVVKIDTQVLDKSDLTVLPSSVPDSLGTSSVDTFEEGPQDFSIAQVDTSGINGDSIGGELRISAQSLDNVDLDYQDSTGSLTDVPVTKDSTRPIISEIKDLSDNIAELKVSNQNILIIFTVLSLLLLAALLAVNRAMINKSYRAIANDNYLRFLFREYKSMPWLYWLFYLLFSMNLGFFLYMLSSHLNLDFEPTVLFLLICIVIVAIIYLTKQVVLQILSATFPVEKEAQLYGFVTMLINNLLGLILVPINLLVAFAPPEVAKWALWFGVAAIVSLYFFRQLKGLFISGKFITSYQFHFFLYLCTAEIAPLLILGKFAVVNFGFH